MMCKTERLVSHLPSIGAGGSTARAITRMWLAFLCVLLLGSCKSLADSILVTIDPGTEPVMTRVSPFLLRFTPASSSESRKRLHFFVRPLELARGAGLVVANEDGPLPAPAFSVIDPYTGVRDKLERVDLFSVSRTGGNIDWATSFEIEAGSGLELSNPGIYYVSYSHPTAWTEAEQADESLRFSSRTLVVAVVTSERLEQLRRLREENTDLALASHQFRHFFRAHPCPSSLRFAPYRRLREMDAIKIGAQRDEVLYLLGPPDGDSVGRHRKRPGKSHDECWSYRLSNTGGVSVYFLDGQVVEITHGFDQPELHIHVGNDSDYVRFILGPPTERHGWKDPKDEGYDEVWSYAWGVRVWFLKDRVVDVKNIFEHPEAFKEETQRGGKGR